MTADTPGPRQSDALRALLLMCLGASMFPFLNTGIKLLTPHYSVIEIVWARFAGHLLTMIAVFLPTQGWRVFRANRPVIQITRSFLLLSSVSSGAPSSTPSFLAAATTGLGSSFLLLYLMAALLFSVAISGVLIIRRFTRLVV